MELGYDGVMLAVYEREGDCFRAVGTRGLAMGLPDHATPSGSGASGQVLSSGEPVVVADYQSLPGAASVLQEAGARTVVGVPVSATGELVAVLIAALSNVQPVQEEDIEALRILGTHAGGALGVLGRLQAEQALSATHARASLTDQLTGIGNRRAAEQQLARLAPGDAVVLIDLDHFKQVNDSHGHATGDEVLRTLARFLADNLREADHVTRYGGEEFLLILPATRLEHAARIVDRVRSAWPDASPLTTFSAGAAQHTAAVDPATTLSEADSALYRAKRQGRNRVVSAG